MFEIISVKIDVELPVGEAVTSEDRPMHGQRCLANTRRAAYGRNARVVASPAHAEQDRIEIVKLFLPSAECLNTSRELSRHSRDTRRRLGQLEPLLRGACKPLRAALAC